MKLIIPTAKQIISTNSYICKQKNNIFSVLDKGKIESAIQRLVPILGKNFRKIYLEKKPNVNMGKITNNSKPHIINDILIAPRNGLNPPFIIAIIKVIIGIRIVV